MAEDKKRSLRDHGLGNLGEPDGTPKATTVDQEMPCPNCGCQLMQVEVSMKNIAQLRGGGGIGTYLGCPACPFASPMMIRSR